jgi:hypothetical protein
MGRQEVPQLGLVVARDLHSEPSERGNYRLHPDLLGLEFEDLEVTDLVASNREPDDAWCGRRGEQSLAEHELVLPIGPELEGSALRGGAQQIAPRPLGVAPEYERRRCNLAPKDDRHLISKPPAQGFRAAHVFPDVAGSLPSVRLVADGTASAAPSGHQHGLASFPSRHQRRSSARHSARSAMAFSTSLAARTSEASNPARWSGAMFTRTPSLRSGLYMRSWAKKKAPLLL